jgi:tRNA pseudouridine38-40 synthase
VAGGPRRIAIGVEYDGSAYAGWQTQVVSTSVQAVVESAIGTVADHPVSVTCAGRTDAGVHALGQVAHFDSEAERSSRAWALGANTHLPNDVCVLWAREVAADFHARYSALARTYRYVILNRPIRPALGRQRVCWMHRPLDVERMAAGAAHLLGEHDFSAFRSAECQSRTPIRRMDAIEVGRSGEYVVIEVRANAFLHHMVRNIAGVLMEIGTGDATPEWARTVLEGRDRTRAGVTAAAGGLYLARVDYPEAFGLPRGDLAGSNDLSFIMPHFTAK